MTKLLLCILLLSALPFGRAQQTVTQEQCQQADDQLNQVYQKLRGTLNDAQKQQLKQAQREWIKKRDAFVAQNSGNPQGVLYQATMQRVGELNEMMERFGESSSDNKANLSLHKKWDDENKSLNNSNYKKSDQAKYKVEIVYQEITWEMPNKVCEAKGKIYRAISIQGSNKVYIFDAKTRLLYGSYSMNSWATDEEPPDFLCLCNGEKSIYAEKSQAKGQKGQVNDISSLIKIFDCASNKRDIYGPFADSKGNIGVYIPDEMAGEPIFGNIYEYIQDTDYYAMDKLIENGQKNMPMKYIIKNTILVSSKKILENLLKVYGLLLILAVK